MTIVWHNVGTKTIRVEIEKPAKPENPISSWSVTVNPTIVEPNNNVTITANVRLNKSVPLRMIVKLFGQTKIVNGNMNGQCGSNCTLRAVLVAPSNPSNETIRYPGTITLDWGQVESTPEPGPNPRPIPPRPIPPVY